MDLGVYIIVHCGRWGGSITKRQTAQNQNVANNMSVATKSSSSYVTEVRDVSGFTGISLRGIGRVRLQQTGSESLEVRAPKRWMVRIETRVKNGTLILGFKKRVFPFFVISFRQRDDIEFNITADVIEQLGISGAGSFETDDLHVEDLDISISGAGRISSRGIEAKTVHVNISGSGKATADRLHADAIHMKSSGAAKLSLDDVSVNDFHASLSGVGRVEAAGSARDVDVRISGSGSLRLEKLETTRCKARISGTGKIRVHVKEFLETSISGSGSVLYKGTPQLSGRTSGSGRVARIDEE